MKNKKSFILHKDFSKVLVDYDNEEKGMIFQSIFDYQNGTLVLENCDKWLIRVLRPLINQFEREEEKYIKTCEARAAAGSKGGKQKVANLANTTKNKQKVANLADNDSDSDNDSDNDSENNIYSYKEIDAVYSSYPPKCSVSGRKTAKSSKDRLKIYKLMKGGHDKDELIELIHLYVNDCKKTNRYLKDFRTFLNNLPDKKDYEVNTADTEKEITEIKRDLTSNGWGRYFTDYQTYQDNRGGLNHIVVEKLDRYYELVKQTA